jgi:ABC-type multidrug transport system fused ATPase/permease subunit
MTIFQKDRYMKLGEIIKLWFQENLLLFKDWEKFRLVTAVRVVSFVVISITCVVIYQLLMGILTFDMGFVVGIFAIFISWLFFWFSQRSQARQETNLLSFLRELKQESMKSFDKIHEKLDSRPAFKGEQAPTPSDQDTYGLTDEYAKKLSEQMQPHAKQIFLAMAKLDRPIEVDQPVYYRYEHGESDIGCGGVLLSFLIFQLNEAELVKYKGASKNSILLTLLGKAFAKWLCEHDQKASYFESPQLTKWGEPSENAEKCFR